MVYFFSFILHIGLIPLEPKDENHVSCAYTPNSVTLLKLPEQKPSPTGIEIRFNNLIINTEMGEYVLIGAGEYLQLNEYLPIQTSVQPNFNIVSF